MVLVLQDFHTGDRGGVKDLFLFYCRLQRLTKYVLYNFKGLTVTLGLTAVAVPLNIYDTTCMCVTCVSFNTCPDHLLFLPVLGSFC